MGQDFAEKASKKQMKVGDQDVQCQGRNGQMYDNGFVTRCTKGQAWRCASGEWQSMDACDEEKKDDTIERGKVQDDKKQKESADAVKKEEAKSDEEKKEVDTVEEKEEGEEKRRETADELLKQAEN